MEWERAELHASVREGYQILLRADAALCLPIGQERIAAYYRSLAEKSISWICDVFGESLRKRFLALDDVRDMSRFGTRRYRFSMECVWERAPYVAFLCEGRLDGEADARACTRRRSAALWRTDTEQILPPRQVEELLLSDCKEKRPPFSPDGVYPRGKEVIFFQNPTWEREGAEWKIPMSELAFL